MQYIVIDSEGDGLAYDCTKLHTLGWTIDGVDYNHTGDYNKMREVLSGSHRERRLVAHNSIRHDLVAFNRILGTELTYLDFVDTLPLSWTLNYQRNSHGLGSYGEDYDVPKPLVEDWVGLSYEEYSHRVIEDVKIGWRVWKDLENKLDVLYGKDLETRNKYVDYLGFKMNCARIQEAFPLTIDTEAAQRHLEALETQRDPKYAELAKAMPSVPVMETKSYPKKPLKQDGSMSAHGIKWQVLLSEQSLPLDTVADVTYVKEYIEPNPQSDVQIKSWLTGLGWEPKTFKFTRNKETGEEKQVPQIRYLKGHPNEGELCEEILALANKEPAVEVLAGLSIIKHRVGFFKGFLENHKDGKIVASIEGLTNTLRFQHRKPLANIPGVDKKYGKEIRSCIIAPKGYKLCGADLVSLEDTTKRHYMQPYDPVYVEEMQQPGYDPHLNLAVFAGALTPEQYIEHSTGVKSYGSVRKAYKVVNYSAVYGVGAVKLAREAGLTKKEAQALLDAYWKRNWSVQEVASKCEVKSTGQTMWLKNPVSGFWYQLRSERDRFSTLNQGTGVFCFDTWLYFVNKLGITIRGQWHDEIVFYTDALDLHKLKEAIDLANTKLKLNVPIGVDIKTGNSYAEVH